MDWLRHIIFKWMTALLYFGLIFALLLFFPISVWPVLLLIYAAYALWSLWVTDAEVSREYDLRPLTRWDIREYDRLKEWLSRAEEGAGLRRQIHYAVMEDEIPNAMAVGGLNGILIFTTGALRLWTTEELAAVAGHELKHLSSRDSLPAILGCAWLMIIGYISNLFRRISHQDAGGVTGLIATVVSAVLDITLWVLSYLAFLSMAQRSRYVEHQADLMGARLTSAAVMISALEKLEQKMPEFVRKEQHAKWSPAWITERLHASHPPAEVRIAVLQAAVERGEVNAA